MNCEDVSMPSSKNMDLREQKIENGTVKSYEDGRKASAKLKMFQELLVTGMISSAAETGRGDNR